MESSSQSILGAMLAASMSHPDLPPIIDAEQAAALHCCSKGQVEDLAESGRLPGTKYGRGWVLVTAQIVYSVFEECTSNAQKRAAAAAGRPVDPPRPVDAGTTHPRSSKPLTFPPMPRTRGRPRKNLPGL